MRWLLAAVVSWACFYTTVAGTFRPLRDPAGLEYVFIWPGGPALVFGVLAGLVALGALYALVRLIASRRGPEALTRARTGRWLSPLAALGVVAIGLVPAIPGVGIHGAPLGYLFYDLRGWWCLILVALTAARLDDALGRPMRTRLQSIATWSVDSRRLLIDAALFLGLIAWAAITTVSTLEYSGAIAGDEPKYVRFDEVWYQGQGLRIDTKALMADQPLDAPPAVLRNLRLIAGSVVEEARALPGDLAGAATDPRGFKWNRAHGSQGFLTGKRGGGYEMYQPGFPLVLFPAYFLDRYLLGLTPGYQAEFPADLVMTRVFVLLMYGACGVALFRLLRRVLESDGLACVWAAIGMMLLPTSAYALELYPEITSAFMILVVVNYAWFHAGRLGTRAAAFAAIATGLLAWFHVRFLILSTWLFVFGIFRTRGAARRAWIAGWVLMIAGLTAIDYHITGSWMPNALYAAQQNSRAAFEAGRVGINLMGYLFDWLWGIVPHAPVLFFALPGLAVLAARSIRRAGLITLTTLALGIPAAGHTFAGTGTTPGRLVLAVTPLLVLPIAAFARQFWASRLIRGLVVAAVVVSVASSLTYNRHWEGERLLDRSASGWKVNLAFPGLPDARFGATSGEAKMKLLEIAGLVGLACAVAFVRSRRKARPAPRRTPLWLASGLVVTGIAVLGTVGTAATDRGWAIDEYLIQDGFARRDVLNALLVQDRCRVCFTSRRRQIDWTWWRPNPIEGLQVRLDFDRLTVIASVRVDSGASAGGFGRMGFDFGDESGTAWQMIRDPVVLKHTYAKPGRYRVDAWLQLPTGERRVTRYLAFID